MSRYFSRLVNTSLLALLLASSACLFAGCQSDEPTSAQQMERTPEAKFARFEADLQRRCQESSGSLVAENDGGLGTTSVRTVIDPPSCVWHAPQTPDGHYTAEVTFVTRLTYASSMPVETPVDDPSQLKAPGQKKPVSSVEESEAHSKPTADTPVRKLGRQEEFRDTFDLVYRENRWQVTSREVPESTQLLLDRALEAQ